MGGPAFCSGAGRGEVKEDRKRERWRSRGSHVHNEITVFRRLSLLKQRYSSVIPTAIKEALTRANTV